MWSFRHLLKLENNRVGLAYINIPSFELCYRFWDAVFNVWEQQYDQKRYVNIQYHLQVRISWFEKDAVPLVSARPFQRFVIILHPRATRSDGWVTWAYLPRRSHFQNPRISLSWPPRLPNTKRFCFKRVDFHGILRAPINSNIGWSISMTSAARKNPN